MANDIRTVAQAVRGLDVLAGSADRGAAERAVWLRAALLERLAGGAPLGGRARFGAREVSILAVAEEVSVDLDAHAGTPGIPGRDARAAADGYEALVALRFPQDQADDKDRAALAQGIRDLAGRVWSHTDNVPENPGRSRGVGADRALRALANAIEAGQDPASMDPDAFAVATGIVPPVDHPMDDDTLLLQAMGALDVVRRGDPGGRVATAAGWDNARRALWALDSVAGAPDVAILAQDIVQAVRHAITTTPNAGPADHAELEALQSVRDALFTALDRPAAQDPDTDRARTIAGSLLARSANPAHAGQTADDYLTLDVIDPRD